MDDIRDEQSASRDELSLHRLSCLCFKPTLNVLDLCLNLDFGIGDKSSFYIEMVEGTFH